MSAAIETATPLVKHFEGLVLVAAPCPAGVPTVGWGHTGHDVDNGLIITKSRAEALLAEDLADAEDEVDALVSVDLTDYEKAALISFVFNLGGHNLEDSTLLRELNAGDRSNVEDNFAMWCKASVRGVKTTLPGLVLRRKAEAQLFLTGRWSA